MNDGRKRYVKINEAMISRVRRKYDKATGILSACLGDIQQVPCFSSDEVKILSDVIDQLRTSWVELEKVYKAKMNPEDWSK